jgi:hypothetical protein
MSKRVLCVLARVLLGTVLICSASLKMGTSPPAWFYVAVSNPSSAWVYVVLAELLLGLLLVTGVYEEATLAISGGFFLGMCVVAASLEIIGESSCGCFGRMPVRPLSAAIFDLACVLIILCLFPYDRRWRLNCANGSTPGTFRRRAIVLSCGVIALVAVSFALFRGEACLSGSWVRVIPGAERLWVQQSTWAGTGGTGELLPFTIAVRNRGDEPALLYGAEAPCSVSIVSRLPVMVGAGERLEINGRIRVAGSPGLFATRLQFFTSASGQSVMYSVIAGRVVPQSDP